MISYDQELQIHSIHKMPAFEGWYFRVVDKKISLAIIIGIAKTKTKQEAFIQIFHSLNQTMEKVSYSMECFEYKKDPFTIVINKTIIKRHYIHIEDPELSTVIDLWFGMPLHIKQTKFAPTIMGPFAYLKDMQCHHAVINLGSQIYGSIKYCHQYFDIQGILYQEKDWGYSFPKKYIWIQSNCCIQKNAVLFLSCATIPLKIFEFTGVIMIVMIEGKEHRFASYLGARVIEAIRENDYFSLKIKQGRMELRFKIYMGPLYILDAPEEGLMLRNVQECLLGRTELEIIENKQSKDVLSFHHCGIENDQFF